MKIDKNTKRGRIYRIFLVMALFVSILMLAGVWVWDVWQRVPSSIRVRSGEEAGINFSIPATATIYREEEAEKMNVALNREITFYGEAEDTYTMKVELFGFIPFKETSVSVIRDTMLTPVGCPIGIYVQTEGILVIDTGSFSSPSGKEAAPAKGVLKQGDYILNIDGREPESKEELMEIIAESEGKTLLLTVNRDGEEICLPITPEQNAEGEYKLGIWVRDSAQGIGTLTFVDENGFFGALGHGINDLDTTELMELKTGGLYKTDIISITRSIPGSPGELTGVIAYAAKNKLGEIVNNTSRGIYGILEEEKIEITEEPLKLALKQEIEKGPAQILCTLTDEPAWYDIEITAIHEENDNINRGLEIKVTDEELLNIAGGIVQGMSGSPIVQNGKLAGAVTHVMVNDPTRGYGIFIEEMLGQ